MTSNREVQSQEKSLNHSHINIVTVYENNTTTQQDHLIFRLITDTLSTDNQTFFILIILGSVFDVCPVFIPNDCISRGGEVETVKAEVSQ